MLTSLFIVVAFAAMLPAILIAPHTSMFVWSWFSYMNPHRNTWSFANTLPLLDIVAAFTFVAWFISRDRKLPDPHPVMFAMLAFLLWTSITTIFAEIPDAAQFKLTRFAKIILFTLFTMVFITSKNRIRYFIYTILLGLALYSVKGGIFTLLSGGKHIVFGPPKSFLADNNQLALAFITVCPLFYWAYKHGETQLIRLVAAGAGALTLVSVIGSQSRGALVALAGMFAWICVIGRRPFLGITLSLAVVGSAFVLMPDTWTNRMKTIGTYEEDGSANSRLQMWAYATNIANAKPVFGGGFDYYFDKKLATQYMPGDGKIYAAHSIYFDVLGEHAYIGLFLYLLLFCSAFLSTVETRKIAKGNPDYAWAVDLAQMLQFSLIGFGLGGAFLSLSTFDLYYHVLSLAMLVHCLVLRELNPKRAGFSLSDLTGRKQTTSALPAE